MFFQNPFSYGSELRRGLALEWSASNRDSGDLVGVFHRNGIASDGDGTMRLLAKKPGRIVIK